MFSDEKLLLGEKDQENLTDISVNHLLQLKETGTFFVRTSR